MNGLTLLGLLGMAWVAVSVVLGVGIGRCLRDPQDAGRGPSTRQAPVPSRQPQSYEDGDAA